MPAKLKLTYALVEQIVELKRDGLCDADIIAAIGVHQATFYRWLKEGENAKTGVKRALYEELKKAEAQYKRCLLTTIKSAAESRAQYWTAAAWLLERKYPMEYGKTGLSWTNGCQGRSRSHLWLRLSPAASQKLCKCAQLLWSGIDFHHL